MTTHLVVAVDGMIEHCTSDLHADPLGTINTAVGPEGHHRVRLLPDLGIAGFVNDTGLCNPKTYPRNIVGSCLLVALGANLQPYAGPVVLTGWDMPMRLGYPTEIVPLAAVSVDQVADIHAQVLAALAGRPVRGDYPHEWPVGVREVAEHVRTTPTPQTSIRPLDGLR